MLRIHYSILRRVTAEAGLKEEGHWWYQRIVNPGLLDFCGCPCAGIICFPELRTKSCRSYHVDGYAQEAGHIPNVAANPDVGGCNKQILHLTRTIISRCQMTRDVADHPPI